MLSSQGALLQNIARTGGTRSSRESQITQEEEKGTHAHANERSYIPLLLPRSFNG